MRYLYVYDWVQKFSIYIQSKFVFTYFSFDNFTQSFAFVTAIALVNKTELYFSLILCNAM